MSVLRRVNGRWRYFSNSISCGWIRQTAALLRSCPVVIVTSLNRHPEGGKRAVDVTIGGVPASAAPRDRRASMAPSYFLRHGGDPAGSLGGDPRSPGSGEGVSGGMANSGRRSRCPGIQLTETFTSYRPSCSREFGRSRRRSKSIWSPISMRYLSIRSRAWLVGMDNEALATTVDPAGAVPEINLWR